MWYSWGSRTKDWIIKHTSSLEVGPGGYGESWSGWFWGSMMEGRSGISLWRSAPEEAHSPDPEARAAWGPRIWSADRGSWWTADICWTLSPGLASQLPLLASFQTATPTDHSSWKWRLTDIEETESKVYFQMLKACCWYSLPRMPSSCHACPMHISDPGFSCHVSSSRKLPWVGP